MTKFSNDLGKTGLFWTKTYVALLVVGIPVFAKSGLIELHAIRLNELGDFFAGLFGPLAIFWLVLGFFQQSRELHQSTEAIRLQASEIKNSTIQQEKIASATDRANDAERRRQTVIAKAECLKIYSDVTREIGSIPTLLAEANKSRQAVYSAIGLSHSGPAKKWESEIENKESEMQSCFECIEKINIIDIDFDSLEALKDAEAEFYDLRNRLNNLRTFAETSISADIRERQNIREDRRRK